MNTIQTLDNRPFRHLITTIGALPTSFIDSMSYYEMLAWLCDYLQNTVIPAVDNNAEALQELQEAFVTLKNYVDTYFDDLDIQTEVDNKLDEMAESGVLEEIMADYLDTKAVFGFQNVAGMKAATNLIDGSYAKTMGFYEPNDGGAATYRVREVTNEDVVDEKFIIALSDNQLVAELLTAGKSVNVLTIGGQGEHLAPICNYLIPKGYQVFVPRGTYTVTETINIATNSTQFICYGDLTLASDVTLMFNVISYRNIIRLYGTMLGYMESDVRIPDFMHIGGDNRSSNYNDIFIHRVHQCANGIVMMPNGGNYGVAWNEITFDHIHTTYGIVLHTGSTGANWVNENTFTGGRLQCDQGIVFIKGDNQTDYYNGNRFYNCAIDGDTMQYGINIEWCLGNYFNQVRLSEGLVTGGKFIRCGAYSYENHFSSEYMIKPSEIEDLSTDTHYRNYFEIKLRTSTGNIVANKFSTCGGDVLVAYTDCMYLDPCYLDGYNKEDSTWNNTPEFYTEGMIVRVGNTGANKTIVYNLPKAFNNRAIKEFVIFVAARKANSTINIYENNGTTVIATDAQLNGGTEISGYGKMYLARYTGRANYTTQRYWQIIPMN